MLRAVLFDFNGVLVDDELLHAALLRAVVADLDVELSEEDARAVLGREDADALRQILESADKEVDGEHLARLVARKAHYYRVRVRERPPSFFPGALELCHDAIRSGIALGVVAGAHRDEVEAALEREDLGKHFAVIVSSDDGIPGKPDPAGYRLALERLNGTLSESDRLIHPHEVLAIEDSHAGLEAASGAGLVTLAVGHSLPLEELSQADAVAADLSGQNVRCLQGICAQASRR